MQYDPRLDAMRDHPEFKAIMAQLRAEQASMRAAVLQRYPEPGV